MKRHDLNIDVSDSSGVPAATVATTVIFDEPEVEPIVAIMLPGGGYSRGYWDIDWPGGYSEAEYHAQHGWIVVAIDHLGVGESSQPDPESISFQMLAATTAEAVAAVRDRLVSGTLAPNLEPTQPRAIVGLGQSMGGCVTIMTQASHAPYDGIGVLGFSAIHTVLPTPDGGAQVSGVAPEEATNSELARHAEDLSTADVFSYAFHWNVEPALLEADLSEGFPFRLGEVPSWGSATVPPVAVAMLSPGVVTEHAAAVTVPVFIGAGERDVCQDIDAEPAAYPNSRDVTLAVVPGMAHMHNFDRRRRDLWEAIHTWSEAMTTTPR